MYLVDTNIWLERLLEHTRSEEVREFLDHTPSGQLFITDFALHSIGIVLSKLNQVEALLRFVQDAFIDGAVRLIHLEPEDARRVVGAIEQFKLDFDDAYQYAAAEKYDLIIVSFDADFDQTKLGRKTPMETLGS